MAPKNKTRQTAGRLAETANVSSQAATVINTQKQKTRKSPDKLASLKETRCKAGHTAPGTPRGRPSKESLFIAAVASQCNVHPDIVESVVYALEKVAMNTLKETRKLHISFLHGKLNDRPEKPATEKKMFGKLVAVPAQPARTSIKFRPTNAFRKLFE